MPYLKSAWMVSAANPIRAVMAFWRIRSLLISGSSGFFATDAKRGLPGVRRPLLDLEWRPSTPSPRVRHSPERTRPEATRGGQGQPSRPGAGTALAGRWARVLGSEGL